MATERRGSRVLQYLTFGLLGTPSGQGNASERDTGYAEKIRPSNGRGGAYNYSSSAGYGGTSSRIKSRSELSTSSKVSTMRRKGRGSVDNESAMVQSSSGKEYKRGSLSTTKLPNINGRDSSVSNNIYSPEILNMSKPVNLIGLDIENPCKALHDLANRNSGDN